MMRGEGWSFGPSPSRYRGFVIAVVFSARDSAVETRLEIAGPSTAALDGSKSVLVMPPPFLTTSTKMT
jgi:hypothetical protein